MNRTSLWTWPARGDDTTTPAGKLVFAIFAGLAEFERELISERTTAGLASARARGRNGGRPYKMTPAKLRLATVSMGKPDTNVGELCAELGVSRQTLYRARLPGRRAATRRAQATRRQPPQDAVNQILARPLPLAPGSCFRISPSEPPGSQLIDTGANYGNGFLNSGMLDL